MTQVQRKCKCYVKITKDYLLIPFQTLLDRYENVKTQRENNNNNNNKKQLQCTEQSSRKLTWTKLNCNTSLTRTLRGK